MTSTNDGKEVKSNQTSGQKGKTYYIELYKSLEARLSAECAGEQRTRLVCEAWRRVHSLCQHSAPSTHPHLLVWLQRHTARTILQTEWQSPKSKEQHSWLEEAIDSFIDECQEATSKRDGASPQWESQLLVRAHWFRIVLSNPWGHPVLKALLDSTGPQPSDEEVLSWLKEERGVMFVTRLRQLAASKCDDLALLLAAAVMGRARAGTRPEDEPEPPTSDTTFSNILSQEAGFTVDVWELLTDIEFVLLHKGELRSKCIDLAKQTPLRNGYQLVERLHSRLEMSPRDKKLWKNAKEVATLVAQVIIARCMVIPVCAGPCRAALYGCALSLSRQLRAEQLRAAAAALAAPAATARHLYTLATAVHAQCKEEGKSFVCELYVRAITAGMNELERLKIKTEKESEARTSEQTLSAWFIQLGTLLSDSSRLSCECVLTAFSVHPSQIMYERVKAAPPLAPLLKDIQESTAETNSEFGSWATDSRTQSNLVKTSDTLNMKQTQKQANVLSTAIFAEGEALGLGAELCQDLAVLISGPRVKTLFWDMERELLLENCRTYMERTHGGTRALTTELKYLNLDLRSYQHLPEEIDDENDMFYGIEKGYEHLVEFQEPEEIWQDALSEDIDSSDHNSTTSESTFVTSRRKKKTKQLKFSSDDESNPLSHLIDLKKKEKKEKHTKLRSKERNDSKERPHNKGRPRGERKNKKEKFNNKSTKDSELTQSATDNDKPKDIRIKEKKPRKERKKKEKAEKKEVDKPKPTPTGLSRLIGMKVARAPDKDITIRDEQDTNMSNTNLSNNFFINDSDYDSLGKYSLNSEFDPDVLFDGLFSMDEMKSPEKPSTPATDELRVVNGIVVNNSLSFPKFQSVAIQKQGGKTQVRNAKTDLTYSGQSGRSTPVGDDVKNSIKKLIEFRRNKVLNEEPQIYSQDTLEQTFIPENQFGLAANENTYPYNPITAETSNASKIFLNEEKVKQLNSLKDEVNMFLKKCGAKGSFGKKLPNNDSEKKIVSNEMIHSKVLSSESLLRKGSVKKYNRPVEKNIKNIASPDHHLQKPINTTYKSIETPSQVQYKEFLKQRHLSGAKTFPFANSGHHNNPDSFDQRQMPNIVKDQSLSQVTVRTLNNSKYLTYYGKITRDAPQVSSKADTLHKNLLNTVVKHPSSSQEAVPLRIPTTKSLPRKSVDNVSPSQNQFHNFLKDLQTSINAGAKTNDNIKSTSNINICSKQQASTADKNICSKQLNQLKSVDTAPKTFSRLSYMHKNKQCEGKSKISSEQIKSLQNKPTDLLNFEDHLNKVTHLQSKGDIVISKIDKTKTNINEIPPNAKVIVQKVQNFKCLPSTKKAPLCLNRQYPIISNMLSTENSNSSLSSKISQEIEMKIIEQQNSMAPASSGYLSDKDQNELLLLLRQQSKMHPLNHEHKTKEVQKKSMDKVPVNILPKVTSNDPQAADLSVVNSNTKILETKVSPLDLSSSTKVVRDKITSSGSESKKVRNSKGFNKNSSSKPTAKDKEKSDWESVLNALLAHKTPSRGPNALDIVLKKDSFEKRSANNNVESQNTQVKTSSKSFELPVEIADSKAVAGSTQTTIPCKDNAVSTNVVINSDPEQKQDKTLSNPENHIELPTKSAMAFNDKHLTDLIQDDDPFISGIPNSDYDLLEELMDDDLRKEIGELLSDEESYTTATTSAKGRKEANSFVHKYSNYNPIPIQTSESLDARQNLDIPLNQDILYTQNTIPETHSNSQNLHKPVTQTNSNSSIPINNIIDTKPRILSNELITTNSVNQSPSSIKLSNRINTSKSIVISDNKNIQIENSCNIQNTETNQGDNTKNNNNCSNINLVPKVAEVISNTTFNQSNMDPTRVVLTVPQRKPTTNVMVIGNELIYDPFTTIQISQPKINESLTCYQKNTYVALKTEKTPNLALYHASQFATPCATPIVVEKSITLPIVQSSSPKIATKLISNLNNKAETSIYNNTLNELKHDEVVSKTKTSEPSQVLETPEVTNRPIQVSSEISKNEKSSKSKVKTRNLAENSKKGKKCSVISGTMGKDISYSKIDKTMNTKLCEIQGKIEEADKTIQQLKVNSNVNSTSAKNNLTTDVQEKVKTTTKKKYSSRKNQKKQVLDEKDCKIDNMIDKDRIKLKRMRILNRQINHRCFVETIALPYEPIKMLKSDRSRKWQDKRNKKHMKFSNDKEKLSSNNKKNTSKCKNNKNNKKDVEINKIPVIINELSANISNEGTNLVSKLLSKNVERNSTPAIALDKCKEMLIVENQNKVNQENFNGNDIDANHKNYIDIEDQIMSSIISNSSKEDSSANNAVANTETIQKHCQNNNLGSKDDKQLVTNDNSKKAKSNNDLQRRTQNITNSKSKEVKRVSNLKQSNMLKYKDNITFEELPDPTNDPLKKIVRIKLPNGITFKATISGKLNVNVDSIFEDPTIKALLWKNMNSNAKCTLNIKQVAIKTPTQSHTVMTQVNDITYSAPKINSTTETIDLISDDEETNQTFKTEFGNFDIALLKPDVFAKHQSKLSQKCIVKLEKLPFTKTDVTQFQPKNNDIVGSKTPSHNFEKDAIDVIEIDDSSNDSMVNNTVTELALHKTEKLSVDLDDLKKLLIRDLGVDEKTENSSSDCELVQENVVNINESQHDVASTECLVKIKKCDNLLDKMKMKKYQCFVNLVRCDETFKKPEGNKITADTETRQQSRLSQNNLEVTMLNDNINSTLRRSGSLSILNDFLVTDVTNLTQKSKPVIDYFNVSELVNDTVCTTLSNFKSATIFFCNAEWLSTKSNLHWYSNNHTDTKTEDEKISYDELSTDCDSDIESNINLTHDTKDSCMSESNQVQNQVPSFTKLLLKFFENNDYLIVNQNSPKKSESAVSSNSLKRKFVASEHSESLLKISKTKNSSAISHFDKSNNKEFVVNGSSRTGLSVQVSVNDENKASIEVKRSETKIISNNNILQTQVVNKTTGNNNLNSGEFELKSEDKQLSLDLEPYSVENKKESQLSSNENSCDINITVPIKELPNDKETIQKSSHNSAESEVTACTTMEEENKEKSNLKVHCHEDERSDDKLITNSLIVNVAVQTKELSQEKDLIQQRNVNNGIPELHPTPHKTITIENVNMEKEKLYDDKRSSSQSITSSLITNNADQTYSKSFRYVKEQSSATVNDCCKMELENLDSTSDHNENIKDNNRHSITLIKNVMDTKTLDLVKVSPKGKTSYKQHNLNSNKFDDKCTTQEGNLGVVNANISINAENDPRSDLFFDIRSANADAQNKNMFKDTQSNKASEISTTSLSTNSDFCIKNNMESTDNDCNFSLYKSNENNRITNDNPSKDEEYNKTLVDSKADLSVINLNDELTIKEAKSDNYNADVFLDDNLNSPMQENNEVTNSSPSTDILIYDTKIKEQTFDIANLNSSVCAYNVINSSESFSENGIKTNVDFGVIPNKNNSYGRNSIHINKILHKKPVKHLKSNSEKTDHITCSEILKDKKLKCTPKNCGFVQSIKTNAIDIKSSSILNDKFVTEDNHKSTNTINKGMYVTTQNSSHININYQLDGMLDNKYLSEQLNSNFVKSESELVCLESKEKSKITEEDSLKFNRSTCSIENGLRTKDSVDHQLRNPPESILQIEKTNSEKCDLNIISCTDDKIEVICPLEEFDDDDDLLSETPSLIKDSNVKSDLTDYSEKLFVENINECQKAVEHSEPLKTKYGTNLCYSVTKKEVNHKNLEHDFQQKSGDKTNSDRSVTNIFGNLPSKNSTNEHDHNKAPSHVKSDDNQIQKNVTLVYNRDSNVILKGSIYEDPVIGTCYVFPIIKKDSLSEEIRSNSIAEANEKNIIVPAINDKVCDNKQNYENCNNFNVLIPKITYSKKNLVVSEKIKRKCLKRKSDTTENRNNEKRYRKGKNIDYPKITVSAMSESAYSREFKRLFDYCSSIKFSFSTPFHKEYIDVDGVLKCWPIQGCINMIDQSNYNNDLFTEVNLQSQVSKDPSQQSLADEISTQFVEHQSSSDQIYENNFNNMGFGEKSDRVINISEDRNSISKVSAATLSDVKQSQPFLFSEDFEDADKYNNDLKERQIEICQRFISYIQMRDKVQSFFKKTNLELQYDRLMDTEKNKYRTFESEHDSILHDLTSLDFIEPAPFVSVVQVVQVGQLPVSTSVQNPITCDPRVTQVTDASPSQCLGENSPHDSQSPIKTEYTELTTADLSLPLIQEYERQIKSKESTTVTICNENITVEMEVTEIKTEDEIVIKDEPADDYNDDEYQPFLHKDAYSYPNDNTSSERKQSTEIQYDNYENQNSEVKVQQTSENISNLKTDQIAHAMNAAGIISTFETDSNLNTQNGSFNIQFEKSSNISNQVPEAKTTSKGITAISLQQALAQVLPSPLGQPNIQENNQTNSTVTPQVLHVVQGKNKNTNGNQITLVDNKLNNSTTSVLHIVQNKSANTNSLSNADNVQQTTYSGLSLVDASLQGNSQLLHIVNTSNQKTTSNTGQILKRVNLLTNVTNSQGSNEQKMVQILCKATDGKSIHLNAPHQRGMVLRLQPIESTNMQVNTEASEEQNSSPSTNTNITTNKDLTNAQHEIKSRSVYEENYAKFIQNSSNCKTQPEKATSLPKFNQAFGKQVFQDNNIQKESEMDPNASNITSVNLNLDNAECQSTDNTVNLDHIPRLSSPPLLVRKPSILTTQSAAAHPNLVQQIKQNITPMNIQTMHGGVIYTRQIPVNIGGGQTINLITVPSTELMDEANQKHNNLKFVNQGDMESSSIIKIVPQSQVTESSSLENINHSSTSNDSSQNMSNHQPVLTQMRIKLPMLSKAPQMVSGTRVVRPSYFQIQRNVIGGANQPVYQQLVLTAAPPLGQHTIRLPHGHIARNIKVASESQSSSEPQMSTSTLEQLREFDMVLEQVKERSTVQPTANVSSTFKKVQSSDTIDSSSVTSTVTESTQQVLYSIGSNQAVNVAYVRKQQNQNTSSQSQQFVRSPDSSGIVDSPSPSSSTHVQIPHTVTSDSTSSEGSTSQPTQPKAAKIGSKSKSRPKTSNPPNSVKVNTVPPKPSNQKPLEDEQTTQRILYILAEYKEQVENSPDKDKPAPRRRSNPPINPSGSSKRKKSSSGSRRPETRDASPVNGEDTCRTMGSEDSSCGTSQGDCNENCTESNSPQDSPRKVVRKLTFENETPQPRPQPQRNVIVSDGQTITVARGTAGKPTTAVLMPANYILPVSMVKSGQQIAIVTNRGPKLITVGGEGGGNALLLQRLIGTAGLKPVLARPGVRHVRLPTSALHNLQAFNLATATTVSPPDSTASPEQPRVSVPTPELIDCRTGKSTWTDPDSREAKPERASSPEGSEAWNLPTSADPNDYLYEETVRTDNMNRTVLDGIPDRYSPETEAQRIFDKMFDVESKKSYVDSQDDTRCEYDIDTSDCDDKPFRQVVQRKAGATHRTRLTHVSAAALRHKYAVLEQELRLQKSLSEECEDLGVDSPSASELFPEAELLFSNSPAHEAQQNSHTRKPQPVQHQTIPQPDIDDQIATDHLLRDVDDQQDLGVTLGLDEGIVTVSEDGMQATIALDQEEFARSHPNTTFHSEPTEEGEVQPYTITGLKGRHITSTIFHAGRAPATVLVSAPQTTVISQATQDHPIQRNVKYNINQIINASTTHGNLLSSVVVKDDRLTKFDNILTDSRELHLSNTASAVIHSTGNATQVIRRVCYEDEKRDNRFLIDEPEGLIAGDDAKMVAEDNSRDATLESIPDDENSSERHAELFWESNSTSERSEGRRPLDFSSDSDKCCKSPYDENNSTDSSVGTQMRLDSVIKDARGLDRSSADGSSDDTHPPLRTYPAKRMYHNEGEQERSVSGKTRAGYPDDRIDRPDHEGEGRRRASGRGVVKRGCHCCNGSPLPSRPKKPRQRKPNMDFHN